MQAARHVLLAAVVAVIAAFAAAPAHAVNECKVTLGHHAGSGAARKDSTRDESLDIGQSRSFALDGMNFVRNHGPHDIRITLDGLPPRRLAKGEVDPPVGFYLVPATLRSLQCLPAAVRSGLSDRMVTDVVAAERGTAP
jgi:hypothetical protein